MVLVYLKAMPVNFELFNKFNGIIRLEQIPCMEWGKLDLCSESVMNYSYSVIILKMIPSDIQ